MRQKTDWQSVASNLNQGSIVVTPKPNHVFQPYNYSFKFWDSLPGCSHALVSNCRGRKFTDCSGWSSAKFGGDLSRQ